MSVSDCCREKPEELSEARGLIAANKFNKVLNCHMSCPVLVSDTSIRARKSACRSIINFDSNVKIVPGWTDEWFWSSHFQSYAPVCHMHTLYNYLYSTHMRMIIPIVVRIVLTTPHRTGTLSYICTCIEILHQVRLPCTDLVGRWPRGFHPIERSRLPYRQCWLCLVVDCVPFVG